MSSVFGERLRAAFAPPRYIAPSYSGINHSTSGVKAVRLVPGAYGLTLARYTETRLSAGAFTDGEIVDRRETVAALAVAARDAGIFAANAALPESKSYLFETAIQGSRKVEWRTAIEQHLDELVPLPPPETAFDFVNMGQDTQGNTLVAGVGFARRIVDETLSVFDEANIGVCALEDEPFARSEERRVGKEGRSRW